jgi:hypothetical protein
MNGEAMNGEAFAFFRWVVLRRCHDENSHGWQCQSCRNLWNAYNWDVY